MASGNGLQFTARDRTGTWVPPLGDLNSVTPPKSRKHSPAATPKGMKPADRLILAQ